jgi:U3 small nucleolar RNA-associated protein 3
MLRLEAEEPDALSLGMIHLHYRKAPHTFQYSLLSIYTEALLTYATTLAFYLHLRASEKYAQRPDLLRSHPVLDRLLTLKQSLSTLEDLDFAPSDSEEDGDEEDGYGMFDEDGDISMDEDQLWTFDQRKGLEADELNDLLEDAQSSLNLPDTLTSKRGDKPPKKKRKTTSTEPSNQPVFDLIEPKFQSSKPSTAPVDSLTADSYGEATSLQHADAADKSARKKSLRFHTSKIESASARRQGARSNAVGGDDDLPYKERKKEKEARLAKEAKSKVRGLGGEDLNDAEPEIPLAEMKRQRDEESESSEHDEEGPDGYYELVKRKSKEKRVKKKSDYAAAQAASR